MKKPMMRNYGKHLKQRRQKMFAAGKPGDFDFELERGGGNLSEVRDSVFPLPRTLVKEPEILIFLMTASAHWILLQRRRSGRLCIIWSASGRCVYCFTENFGHQELRHYNSVG